MAINIGINGFGRIGRLVFRSAINNDDFNVVSVNDLLDIDHLAYLLKYDSVHGPFDGAVEVSENKLIINGKPVKITAERDPNNIDWSGMGVEVVVRNVAAGSLCRQTYIEEGSSLNPPLVEFYLKDDLKDDPLLTTDRMERMGYTEMLYSELRSSAIKVNDILADIFDKIELTLVDFKLEYGHDSNGNLCLADELSPDSMRLWKRGTSESCDKDLFRKDKGDIVEVYNQIFDKLNNLP